MIVSSNEVSPRHSRLPSSPNAVARRLTMLGRSSHQVTTIMMMTVFAAGILVGSFLQTHQNMAFPRRQLIDTSFQPPTLVMSDATEQQSALSSTSDGWKTIHVFTGNTAHDDNSVHPSSQQPQFSFAQARQDEVVLSLLRNQTGGYFVDLAANDATVLSNTFTLERHYGWQGLCIEPNPTYWYNLTRHRPNCHIVGAVVGQERMEQVYFAYWEREHGGIAGEGFDNGPRHQKSSITEYTVTFQEILHRFQAPKIIDYLSLDVEGAEYFVMKAFPLHEYTIRILTIERPKDELKKLLEQHGYKQILRLSRWGETLWIHSAFERRMDLSRLPEFHGKKQWEQQKARVAAALAESHP